MSGTFLLRVGVFLFAILALPGVRAPADDRPSPIYADKSKLLIFRDAAGVEHPVRDRDDWRKRREHILAAMQLVMGPLPSAKSKVPLDVSVTEKIETDKYTRLLLTYAVDDKDRVPAYLFLPRGEKKQRPAVLCLHPTERKLGKKVAAGLGPKADRGYALHLAERGYVTLAPDYPNMGGYGYDAYKHGYASTTMKAIWNHMIAVDLLQSLPEVDRERIGVIGHSLGGHNSMFVAAFDERIKCIVSNCGFCSFKTYMKGKIAGWAHDGYMPKLRTVYDLKPENVPFDFTEITAALAPRAFLASAPLRDHNFDADGVKECIAAARPVYRLLGAEEKLAANYPDCDHNFPDDVRRVAYEWLDRWRMK
ncbi:MAG: alpha/beta fold hydrolase [Planctomycetes bacterium]|nr:alpha/beta fold hydrolase [Planctomycetota bacterium]